MKIARAFHIHRRWLCTRDIVQSSVTTAAAEEEAHILSAEEETGDIEAGAAASEDPSSSRISLPTISLPHPLQDSINKVLSLYPNKSLVLNGSLISKYVTASHPSNQCPLRYGKQEGVAYAAGRAQGVYGATYRVLNEISVIDTEFKPETMLDFGTGLGTAVWAANSVWGNSIYEYQTVDVSQDMGTLARVLRSGGDEWVSICDPTLGKPAKVTPEAICGVHFRQFLPVSSKVTYDLVVSAYSLSELPSVALMKQTLLSLWTKTNKYLVLIEVGSPSGFDIISTARDYLLKKGKSTAQLNEAYSEGYVAAPCSHDFGCPLLEKQSICYFGQRVHLPRSQIVANRAAGVSIERFSYLVLKKGSRPSDTVPRSRLLLPTKKRTRHTICQLCCPNGEACQVIFTKTKHKDLHREAHKRQWGDTMDVPSNFFSKKHDQTN